MFRSVAAAVSFAAQRSPTSLALVSPFQSGRLSRLSYHELDHITATLTVALRGLGYSAGDVLVGDLPNTAENLVIQLACSRLGAAYATAKDLEALTGIGVGDGAIMADPSSYLSECSFARQPVVAADDSRNSAFVSLDSLLSQSVDSSELEHEIANDSTAALGYYNTSKAYTNAQALSHGAEAAETLKIASGDVVCVSITLCHAFGIGSACTAAILSGAAIALPAVGGIRGCGVPSERAEATLSTLQSQDCTLLFADTHTLKALPAPRSELTLRGGCVKIGSGSTFLEETRIYGGVELATLGKSG